MAQGQGAVQAQAQAAEGGSYRRHGHTHIQPEMRCLPRLRLRVDVVDGLVFVTDHETAVLGHIGKDDVNTPTC